MFVNLFHFFFSSSFNSPFSLQITVGGCDENGQDAFNDITLMCLKAARRLPLNAPCLSLRLTPTTPSIIKEETAKALLSGGAHPILYHDRKMIDGISMLHLDCFFFHVLYHTTSLIGI